MCRLAYHSDVAVGQLAVFNDRKRIVVCVYGGRAVIDSGPNAWKYDLKELSQNCMFKLL